MTSPHDPQAKEYAHIRGTRDDLLDRLAVSELCKGWPVYRDASEWKNYRSLFADDAYVWTTWSKRLHIDAFIEASKKGKSAGDFIMHRECGTMVDLNPATGRAVGKMKVTITQRFRQAVHDMQRGHLTANNWSGLANTSTSTAEDAEAMIAADVEYDVDCDCQFHFFCAKEPVASSSSAASGGEKVEEEWKVEYVKLIYSKDKIVPVDGHRVPVFTPAELAPYPEGYKYLGAAQARLGHAMDLHLPTPGDKARWLDLYEKMGQWLEGQEDIDLVGCGGGGGGTVEDAAGAASTESSPATAAGTATTGASAVTSSSK
ncbi:hypothetical protein Micbo1qcDRAFT_206942 [Microdochium bolleyi]|uniref:SnoaL-like domain-containing protein n=1 Tax=Microdochium bolleyi TaxID=196109 RepID=A0A136IVK3_9PEZI|nr:hypothetical protein Micbo1qcDRAFT_206942 [Microdochium bolleyi]